MENDGISGAGFMALKRIFSPCYYYLLLLRCGIKDGPIVLRVLLKRYRWVSLVIGGDHRHRLRHDPASSSRLLSSPTIPALMMRLDGVGVWTKLHVPFVFLNVVISMFYSMSEVAPDARVHTTFQFSLPSCRRQPWQKHRMATIITKMHSVQRTA